MNRKMLVSLGTVLLATAILLALLTLLAQSDSAAPQPAQAAPLAAVPAVTEVVPSSAPNDLDTPIVISGTDFVVSATVLLNDVTLDDVGWVCTTTLTATVPWGMAPGVYTVTVVNPGEGSGSRPNAFTVTQGFGVFTTDGPYGGSIHGIEKKPGTPTTVYAVAGGVGLFVSKDAGAHWELSMVNNPLDLAFDAQDGNVIYCGSDTWLYRTMDGGDTWEALPQIPDGCYLVFPAAHPSSAGVVYVGIGSCPDIPFLPGGGGVFRSDDYGMTWITKTTGMTDTDVHSIAIHPNDPDKMLAGTWAGNVYASLDGGENWSLSAHLDGSVMGVYFNPYQPLEAWAASIDIFPHATYLIKSTNLTDWTEVIIEPGAVAYWPGGWDIDFLPDTIWVSGSGAYTSTNGGASWTEVPGLHRGANVVAVTPENSQEIYVGNYLGVEKSEDGGQAWQQINEGLAGIVPMMLAVSRTEPDIVCVKTGQDTYRSFNGGHAWQALDHGGSGGDYPNGDYLAIDPYTSTRIYQGERCEGSLCVSISAGSGETWNLITSTLPLTYAGWESYALAVAPHPQIPGRILVGNSVSEVGLPANNDAIGMVYASDDYGQTWACMGPTQPISWIVDIAYDAVDPNLVYMATAGSGPWKSTDGGANWQKVTAFPGVPYVTSLAAHPHTSHTIYVLAETTAGSNLYVSEDAGDTWTHLTDECGVQVIAAPTQPATTLYTSCGGSAKGTCRSTDGGQTWSQVQSVTWPTVLAAGTDGERVVVYVGTPGGMVVQANLEEMLLGAGVYRWTSRLPTARVYLPLILKGYGP